MTAAIVLQARIGSRRLPGKVLAPIAGRTLLEHCVERLRASGLPLIVATTERGEDDRLEAEARRLGADVVRGADADVLARFLRVASVHSLTHLVRATADNPCVDIEAPQRVLDALRETGADHLTECGLPYGSAVEAVSVGALAAAAALTQAADDREHVTLFLQRDARFTARRLQAPAAVCRPDLRLTVDTAEDLAFVRQVIERAERSETPPVPLATLIAAADRIAAPVPSGS